MCSFKQDPEACLDTSSHPTGQTTTTTPYETPTTTTPSYQTTTTTSSPTSTTTDTTTTSSSYSINVEDKFEEFDIVPDVLSKAPLNPLKVKSVDSTLFKEINSLQVEYVEEGVSAEYGNNLDVGQTQSKPKITYEIYGDATKLYTLAMVDPDAPSR